MKTEHPETETGSSSSSLLAPAPTLEACAPKIPARAGEVVEWAAFRSAPGMNDEQIIEASDDLQVTFLRKQAGFLRRDLLKCDDGRWVDVVSWADRTAAELAAKNAAKSDACARYFRCMANPNETVLLFDRMKSYVR